MSPSLSMTPPEATLIGGDLSMQTVAGWTTYFANLVPIDRHAAEDSRAAQLRMARLHLLSGIRQEDVAAAFGFSLSTVTRAVRALPGAGRGGVPAAAQGSRSGGSGCGAGSGSGSVAGARPERQRGGAPSGRTGEHVQREPARGRDRRGTVCGARSRA